MFFEFRKIFEKDEKNKNIKIIWDVSLFAASGTAPKLYATKWLSSKFLASRVCEWSDRMCETYENVKQTCIKRDVDVYWERRMAWERDGDGDGNGGGDGHADGDQNVVKKI